jgi:hypothetical protein
VSLRSAPELAGQLLDGRAMGAGLAAIGGVEVIAAALGRLALRTPSVGDLELEEHGW